MNEEEKNNINKENEELRQNENAQESNEKVESIIDDIVEDSEENPNTEEKETMTIAVEDFDKLNKELEEEQDRYKRLFAEFENYKKRTKKDRENIYGMVTSDLVSTMLPIMDNLEKASNVKTEDKSYQEGVNLVVKQFQSALRGLGLEEIEAVGKRFDPEYHEAVSSIQDPTKGEQEIVEEYRKGYKIGNKVVRHSMVIVAN